MADVILEINTRANPAFVSVPQGGGGGGGGVIQLYTVSQPADGSDFMVTLTTPQPDANYQVFPVQTSGANQVNIETPNIGTDRTATQFRVITSAALANGDTLAFNVVHP